MKTKVINVKNINDLTEEEMERIGLYDFVTDGKNEGSLDFSMRLYNLLKKNGLTNLKKITHLSEVDYLTLNRFGKKCADELKENLMQFNIALKQTPNVNRKFGFKHAY